MNYMFYNASLFNQPINDWDVSNVTNMYGMLCCATSFNQPISDWDVSNVINMDNMFFDATNQPIPEWYINN